MGKELIGKKQMMSIIVLFIFGSSVVVGVSSEAEQDSWVSVLLALAIVIPLMLVYARIVRLNPGKDIFEILETVLGKVAGKVLVALMCWYALHLAALVLRDFSEFIQIVSMPETPQLPLMIMMMLVTAYMARSGIEALWRWTLIALPGAAGSNQRVSVGESEYLRISKAVSKARYAIRWMASRSSGNSIFLY